jgi:hypothetical protein
LKTAPAVTHSGTTTRQRTHPILAGFGFDMENASPGWTRARAAGGAARVGRR